MPEIRLTPTSYIVLGLIDQHGVATPYDLKAAVAVGVGNFWSLNHAQLYAEPERLTRARYLSETREQTGRRRKLYQLTPAGHNALEDWLSAPTNQLPELRDVALLKLYFGAKESTLVHMQLAAHRTKLEEYEQLFRQVGKDLPFGPRATLRAGIAHERAWVLFWEELAKGDPKATEEPM